MEKRSVRYIIGLQSTHCSVVRERTGGNLPSSDCEHRQYEYIVRAKTVFQTCREPEMSQSFGTGTGWVDDLNTSQAGTC